jgi:hypothetical protein
VAFMVRMLCSRTEVIQQSFKRISSEMFMLRFPHIHKHSTVFHFDDFMIVNFGRSSQQFSVHSRYKTFMIAVRLQYRFIV